MHEIKKMTIAKGDVLRIREALEDYAWVVMDCRKGVMVIGDDDLYLMRDLLLMRRSVPEDIFGFGIDLKTSQYSLSRHINRLNPKVREKGCIDVKSEDKLRENIRYFFAHFPAFSMATKNAK